MAHTAPCSRACWSVSCCPSSPKPRRRHPCSPRVPTIRRRSTSTSRRRSRPTPITRRCSRPPWIAPPPAPAGGIVLVPSGRYRVTGTLIVWRAVRVIGYGATRPVFVLPERTPGFLTGLGVMMHFTNAGPAAGRAGWTGHSAARGVPAARLRAGQRDHPGRQPDDLLLVDDERRLRDRRRQSGGGRRPLPRRAARHPERHRLPHRVGAGRHHRGRQRRPAPPVRRRTLRHHGHQHVAVLALHADRLGLRGPARGGDPRAPDRPDRRPHDVPQRARRDQHRQGLLRQPVAEGRPVRARRVRRGRLRPAAERPDPDRGRGCHLCRHAGVRARAGQRPHRRLAVAGLPRPALQPRAVRPRQRQHRPASTSGTMPSRWRRLRRRCRRRCPRCRRWISGSTCGRSA